MKRRGERERKGRKREKKEKKERESLPSSLSEHRLSLLVGYRSKRHRGCLASKEQLRVLVFVGV
jgi:hypothetical protein